MCIYSIYRVLTYSFSYFFLFVSRFGLKLEDSIYGLKFSVHGNGMFMNESLML